MKEIRKSYKNIQTFHSLKETKICLEEVFFSSIRFYFEVGNIWTRRCMKYMHYDNRYMHKDSATGEVTEEF